MPKTNRFVASPRCAVAAIFWSGDYGRTAAIMMMAAAVVAVVVVAAVWSFPLQQVQ